MISWAIRILSVISLFETKALLSVINNRAQNSSHVISNNSCYHFVDKIAFFAFATLATTEKKKKRIGKENHYQKKMEKKIGAWTFNDQDHFSSFTFFLL